MSQERNLDNEKRGLLEKYPFTHALIDPAWGFEDPINRDLAKLVVPLHEKLTTLLGRNPSDTVLIPVALLGISSNIFKKDADLDSIAKLSSCFMMIGFEMGQHFPKFISEIDDAIIGFSNAAPIFNQETISTQEGKKSIINYFKAIVLTGGVYNQMLQNNISQD